MKVVILPDGQVQFIYSDDLVSLLSEGDARITRASHVEPIGTLWRADMAPVDGPVLGPFSTRAEALAAEVAWLDEHLGQVRMK